MTRAKLHHRLRRFTAISVLALCCLQAQGCVILSAAGLVVDAATLTVKATAATVKGVGGIMKATGEGIAEATKYGKTHDLEDIPVNRSAQAK